MKSKIFIGIIAGIAIVLSVVAIGMDISKEIVVTDASLVLGFIGVLATFIVISNSVQLWKFENKIEKYQDLERQKRKIYNGLKLSILNAKHRIISIHPFVIKQ